MFAVPGWSVSADSLKTEKHTPGTSAAGEGGASKSKKRKRAGGNVTGANVADLYDSVVEGKKPKGDKGNDGASHRDQSAKRKKKDVEAKVKAGEGEKHKGKKREKHDKAAKDGVDGAAQSTEGRKSKKDKKDKKKSQQGTQPGEGDENPDTTSPRSVKATAVADLQPPPLPPAPPKLTPLQAAMREKLVSARFRHLNETLYTRPSDDALRLFADAPDMFDEYHEGFRRQVRVWPENPVDSFLADLRARARLKPQPKGSPPAPLSRTPLPRTAGVCTVADLGCGDARLASELVGGGEGKGKGRGKGGDADRLRLDLRSFDLHSPSPLVTRADIAALPLADGAVNVAVLCLALMGTNWVDFVEEAWRVLHWRGELWVAEIKSRFGTPRSSGGVVRHSVGHRQKKPPGGKKGKGGGDGDGDEPAHYGEDLAVEVDGADDRRRETDVTAFVEVLRRRGFVPHGDREAVDLSNKMFVKMRFVKAAPPTRGKNVQPSREEGKGKKSGGARWPGPGDADGDEAEAEGDEAAVLRPCVYKIR